MYAADYAVPTPAMMGAAIGHMGAAYTDAAGRVGPDTVALGSGDVDGKSLPVPVPVPLTLTLTLILTLTRHVDTERSAQVGLVGVVCKLTHIRRWEQPGLRMDTADRR